MANQTSTVYQINQNNLPQWYTDYMSGIAARSEALLGTDKATPKLDDAGNPVIGDDGKPVMNPPNPLKWDPALGQQVAGATPAQIAAWTQTAAQQGQWKPYTDQATHLSEAAAKQDIYGALQPFADEANQMSYAGATYDTQSPANKYFDIGNNLDFAGAAASGDSDYNRGIGSLQGVSDRAYKAGDINTASGFDKYADQASQYARSGANMNGLAVASPYLNAASGSFPENADAYMNPYNRNVTDRIAELGARNLSENLLPSVSDDFIRAGQYGSTRQRDFVGRAVRDTQDSILGKQADVLQQGYGQAANTYQNDANRYAGLAGTAGNLGLGQGNLQLQTGQTLANIGQTAVSNQQTDAARQLQAAQLASQTGLGVANAGLQRGQLGLSAAQSKASNNQAMLAAQNALSESAAQRKLTGGMNALTIGNSLSGATKAQADNLLTSAGQFGAIGNQIQTQGMRDNAALEATGTSQQSINQSVLNAATNNAQQQEQYPWQNLSRATSLVSGAQLPSSGTQQGQSTTPGGSTAGQIGGGILAASALYNQFKAKGGAVKKKPLSRVNYGGSPRKGLSMFAKAA